MTKRYSDYMDEISADDLYEKLLLFGMFSEKLPPIFENNSFTNLCKNHNPGFSFKKDYDYIRYDTIRNINLPRQIGIPVPMVYERLCMILKKHWEELKIHFHEKTDFHNYVISRLHIQLRKQKDAIFEMNYDDWRNSGSPKDDLRIGNKFIVKTDISTCFSSIYTHSIPWAAVGKSEAKNMRNKKEMWYNEIDEACQKLKFKETHGLLIGPHASNLVSEIILLVIDNNLYAKGWRHIRYIDDYTCYVKTKEEAERFITDLIAELAKFDLSLNHKKTKIEELPNAVIEHWVRKLNSFSLLTSYGKVDYKMVSAYFDIAIELMRANGGNASVLNYAIKVLSKQKLTYNAKIYAWKMSAHLCLLYPYLLSIMENNVFGSFEPPNNKINEFVNIAFDDGISNHNYEEVSYAIYFAIKYDFTINNINLPNIISSNDCIYKILAYLYYKKRKEVFEVNALHTHALNLKDSDMDRNWLFVYEVLTSMELEKEWKLLKEKGITFLKAEFGFL